MRTPIHTRDPFGVEAHLLVEHAAQRVEHRPRSCRAILRAFGVDDQAAVVCADEPLDPDVTGFAIHLDLGNLRDHGLAAVGVRHATPRQDDFSVAWFRRDAAARMTAIERARLNPLSSSVQCGRRFCPDFLTAPLAGRRSTGIWTTTAWCPKSTLSMLGKVTRTNPQSIPMGRWSPPISLRPFGSGGNSVHIHSVIRLLLAGHAGTPQSSGRAN